MPQTVRRFPRLPRGHLDDLYDVYLQDDVGANGLQMFCPDTATWHMPDTGSVGVWVEQACPAGLKVCGLQPNVLGYQGPGLDDVGLANMNFRCCGSGKIQWPLLEST